jgi:hypothetical protein
VRVDAAAVRRGVAAVGAVVSDREPLRFSDTRKSDNLRRAAEQARSALSGWANHGLWAWPESALQTCKQNTEEALAALDAALAEPEKERAEVAPPARSGVDKCEIDSLTGEAYPTPQPDAKPEPVVVEQLFALAKLTVRRAADPDPWVWDRLSDDGTWTPFNPLIHGPDMWRLEQALRAALAEPEPTVKESLTVDHIRSIWLDSWKACGNVPTPVLAEHFTRQIERAHGIGLAKPTGKDSLQVASENEVEAMMPRPAPSLEFLDGFRDGWRAAERFHGIRKEDGK